MFHYQCMRYENLNEKRKMQISRMAARLRSKYTTEKGIDFYSMANDFGATLLETDKVAGGVTYFSGNEKTYIFLNKSWYSHVVRTYHAAHEFAHVVFKHNHAEKSEDIKEEEAEYFVEKFT